MRKAVTSRQSPVVSELGVQRTQVSRQPRVAFHGEPERSERGGTGRRGRLRPLRVSAIGILALLCACGFEPLQGQAYRSTLTADLSAIAVSVSGSSLNNGNTNAVSIPRRYGELLKAEIEDSVNPKAAQSTKQFALSISFTESDIALFVNPDGTASRGNLDYLTSYSLTRLADGKIVASGSIRRVSSYNSSPTADFASYISIEDARKRAMQELAQDYKLRLAALLPTLNDRNATIIETKPEAPKLELQPLQRYETIAPRN